MDEIIADMAAAEFPRATSKIITLAKIYKMQGSSRDDFLATCQLLEDNAVSLSGNEFIRMYMKNEMREQIGIVH